MSRLSDWLDARGVPPIMCQAGRRLKRHDGDLDWETPCEEIATSILNMHQEGPRAVQVFLCETHMDLVPDRTPVGDCCEYHMGRHAEMN